MEKSKLKAFNRLAEIPFVNGFTLQMIIARIEGSEYISFTR